MSNINTKKKNKNKAHLNWMGGDSYDLSDPIHTLRIAAASCFFGEPMYYHREKTSPKPKSKSGHGLFDKKTLDHLCDTLQAADPQEWRGMSPTELMEKAIDKALDHDVEKTLIEAVRLRNEDFIRTTPQVILVRAAHHPKGRGTGLINKFGSQICDRGDEPAVGLAYHLQRYDGNPLPNSLKKVWAKCLSALSEYHLAKYRMDNRVVKTVDVVNLCHAKSEAIGKLMRGELKNTATWEARISAQGANQKSWTNAVDDMGHMALLRNLRNFINHGVSPEKYLKKLVRTAKDGKQLPFRYYSAYSAVKDTANGQIKDAIEECLSLSLSNIPKFSGKTISLCDNSGSAQGSVTSSMGTIQVSTIANLTGIITGANSDDGWIGLFGDNLIKGSIRKKASIFDQLDSAEGQAKSVGMGTENGIWIFWKEAIEKREHWDNVFIYSDMQAGHGGLYGRNPSLYQDYRWFGGSCIDIPKLIAKYRNEVNPRVNVFLCQVAGYRDTIVPEHYYRTFVLGGWGDGILRFAHRMIDMADAKEAQKSAQKAQGDASLQAQL